MEQKSTPYFWSRFGLSLFFGIVALFFFAFDGRSGVLLGAATLAVFFIAVVCRPIRYKSRTIHPLISAPVLLFAVIAVVEITLPRCCSVESVEPDITPLIQQLDAYKTKHGHFPETLEAASIKPPAYRGGGEFFYAVDTDGTCWISVGDYALDGFSASWDSAGREWSFDT